jgi:ankyrin repeat protein
VNRKRFSIVATLFMFSSILLFGAVLCQHVYGGSGHQELTSAMTDAIIADNVQGVKAVLKRGLPVNETGYRRSTFLMMASTTGNAQIVTVLLNAGAKINAKDTGGETALMKAVTMNHSGVVKLLIQHKADVNTQDGSGRTPLMYVAYEGNVDLIRALLTAKANRLIKSQNGFTASTWAMQGKHPGAIQLLQNQ